MDVVLTGQEKIQRSKGNAILEKQGIERPEEVAGRLFKGTFIPLILKAVLMIEKKGSYLEVEGHSLEKEVFLKTSSIYSSTFDAKTIFRHA